MVVNIVLSGVKFTFGIVANSQALVADAVHSLSDLTTDLAIIVGVGWWSKPADDEHPHGHRRLEIIVTVAIGVVLAAVAVGLLWNALSTIHLRHATGPGLVALFAAMLSIVSKEWLYRWTVKVAVRLHSEPLRANAWHHRSDALSSIPVAVAVGVAALKPEWAFVDHVGAVLVSLFIMKAAYEIVRPSISKLLDTSAPLADIEEIRRLSMSVPGVLGVDKIRTRYIGCSILSVEIHIEVRGNMTIRDGHGIGNQVRDLLVSSDLGIGDVVVHLDPVD
jgi:cation diffusion facilitator family transporter